MHIKKQIVKINWESLKRNNYSTGKVQSQFTAGAVVKKRQGHSFPFGKVKECVGLQSSQAVKRVRYINEPYRTTLRFRGLHRIDIHKDWVPYHKLGVIYLFPYYVIQLRIYINAARTSEFDCLLKKQLKTKLSEISLQIFIFSIAYLSLPRSASPCISHSLLKIKTILHYMFEVCSTVIKHDVPLRKRVKSQDCDKHTWKKQRSSNKILGKIGYSGTS
jgi:hypothetical protein